MLGNGSRHKRWHTALLPSKFRSVSLLARQYKEVLGLSHARRNVKLARLTNYGILSIRVGSWRAFFRVRNFVCPRVRLSRSQRALLVVTAVVVMDASLRVPDFRRQEFFRVMEHVEEAACTASFDSWAPVFKRIVNSTRVRGGAIVPNKECVTSLLTVLRFALRGNR